MWRSVLPRKHSDLVTEDRLKPPGRPKTRLGMGKERLLAIPIRISSRSC